MLAVIGGSGVYAIEGLQNARWIKAESSFGRPSDEFLMGELGGEVIECCFVVDLPDIGGRKRLEKLGLKVFTLCEFEGE